MQPPNRITRASSRRSLSISTPPTTTNWLPLIATTVAKLTNKPPETVATELGAILDGDALDRLFVPPAEAAQPTGCQLVLSVAGCTVTVVLGIVANVFSPVLTRRCHRPIVRSSSSDRHVNLASPKFA